MMKKSLIFIISVILCFFSVSYCFAENGEITDKETKTENRTRKGDEKPILGSGETGVLIDAKSGTVLFEVDKDKKMYPASTTKIMTALLAIEAVERGELRMTDTFEITHEMLADLDPDGSSMDLKEGEIVSLDALLKGLMIPSGNDAACAISQVMAKSRIEFANKMNERAAELGCTNTNFMNPNGLHDENHYTTAADMAKIARCAMQYASFRNIADIAHIKIPPTNKTEKERYYISTNGLLSTMRYSNYYYKYATGIKTGNTLNAGNCLVSSATKGSVNLIGVVFGGKTVADSHTDSTEMLSWGFENFESINALSKGDMPCEIKVKQAKGNGSLALSAKEDVPVTVPKDTKKEELEIRPEIPKFIKAPISAGEKIGTVSVLRNGEVLGTGELVATSAVERSIFWPAMALGDWLWSNMVTRIIIILIAIAIVVFILMFITEIYKNIKRAKRRKRRYKRRIK